MKAVSKVLRDSAYELLRELESPVRDHNMIRVRTQQLKVRIQEWDEKSLEDAIQISKRRK